MTYGIRCRLRESSSISSGRIPWPTIACSEPGDYVLIPCRTFIGAGSLMLGVGRLLPRNDMLCDICQQREATIHNTEIDGDVTRHSNFCDSCFEVSKPTEARDLTA